MTPLQKKKAIDIIRNDATLIGSYCEGDKMCVIGGLLHAAGMSKKKLQNLRGSIHWVFLAYEAKPSKRCGDEIFQILEKKYGIGRHLAAKLQRTNDWEANLKKRRKLLIDIIKSTSESHE